MPQERKPSTPVYLKFGSDVLQHTTEKAFLFVIDNEQIWMPKSQVMNLDESGRLPDDGEHIIVKIPDWIAEKNDLMDHIDEDWVAMGCPD